MSDRIVMVTERVHTSGYQYSKPLDDLIAELKEIKSTYPFENLRVDIDAHDDYGSPNPDFQIYFERPENETENRDRLAREKSLSDRRIADAKKVLGLL